MIIEPIAVGDIVTIQHLSGPEMLVEEVRKDGTVCCIWFDKNQSCHRDGFHPGSLRRS